MPLWLPPSSGGGSGGGPTNTDGLPEGSSNLYFTAGRVRAAVLTGLSFLSSVAVTAADSVLVAIGKLQAQLTGKADQTALDAHVTDTTNPHGVTKAQVGLGSAENKSSATIRGELTSGNVTGALGFTPEDAANRGAANGYAPLGADVKVPAAYLPSYVDDVLEYADLASLPATGESGKLYVTLDALKTYRWSGSAYAEVSASPGSTDAVPEGVTNLYFTAARVRAAVLTGLSLLSSAAITAADTVLQAFGKLQAQLTALTSTVSGKADASALTAHTGDTGNPHAVTKAQVGLGSAENKSSATIRGELTASNVTTALTYTPQVALGFTPENAANKGIAGGYAGLDGTGKVPAVQLPSYVDDVLEYANLAALPVTGDAGLLYVTLDTNKIYRWSGSAYVEISGSPGSTDAVPEGASNLYFTAGRVLATVLSGFSTASSAAITAADTVLAAFGKLQAQVSGKANASHSHAIGDVTASGTPSVTTFLRGDSTWAAPTASLSAIPAGTMIGNAGSSAAVPQNLTPPQVNTVLGNAQIVSGIATLFGHSYYRVTTATYDQTGRMDAMLRSALRWEAVNWYNMACDGARVTRDCTATPAAGGTGAWAYVFGQTQRRGTAAGTKKIAPYSPVGGITFLQYGLNDLGQYTNTTQIRTAYIHAMRACVSRVRSAIVWDPTDSVFTYGAGFVSTTGLDGGSTMGTVRRATTTTTATITLTIPADYDGGTIAMAFLGQAGVVGGTVTFSGTAGWTGTLSTSNIQASANATTCPVVKRGTAPITGATQTIIATVTQVDASGKVDFDSAWIESLYPPPVIVCNIPRITATAATAVYTAWTTAQPTQAGREADVVAWNAALTTLVAEFDSMVQIADIDNALGPMNTAYLASVAIDPTQPQLHPNEIGNARCVDAHIAAINNLVPVGSIGAMVCMTPSPAARTGIAVGFRPLFWYTSPGCRFSASTYACVAGDMFAIPFEITANSTRFDQWGIEAAVATTTGTVLKAAIYFNSGLEPRITYPGMKCVNGDFGNVSVLTGAAFKSSAVFGTPIEMDPGVYWLVIKVTAVGAGTTLRMIDGPSLSMPGSATGVTAGSGLGNVGYKWTGQATGTNLPIQMPTTGSTMVASAPAIMLHSQLPGT